MDAHKRRTGAGDFDETQPRIDFDVFTADGDMTPTGQSGGRTFVHDRRLGLVRSAVKSEPLTGDNQRASI
jgi:hypothetical protein